MLVGLLCLCGFLFVQSTPVPDGEYPPDYFADEGNANEFIDEIVKVVKDQYKEKLDPFALPEQKAGFEKKIGLITFKGEAHLRDGVLHGLASLRRSKDAKLEQRGDGGFVARLGIGLDELDLQYQAGVSFMDLHKDVIIGAKVGFLEVDVAVALEDGKPKLEEFTVQELQNVEVKFQGKLKILDAIIEKIAGSVVKVFNKQVKETVSDVVGKLLADVIKNIKIGGQKEEVRVFKF